MLTTARAEIPTPIEVRLKRSAEFVDNVMDFAREDLIGFKRPIAATFAYTAPIVCVFAFMAGGLIPLLQVAASYFAVAIGSIYLVGRNEWPGIVDEFERRSLEKRRAIADLKCGFSESTFLNLERAPRFYEYEYGVLALIDAGDFKTLFMSIDRDPTDPRWKLYKEGELDRRVWRWQRLPVSRELVRFSCEASKLPGNGPARKIKSIDAWEAINVALGEPLDGAILHRPFDEAIDAIDRLA